MIDVISNKSNLFIPFGISVKGSSKTESYTYRAKVIFFFDTFVLKGNFHEYLRKYAIYVFFFFLNNKILILFTIFVYQDFVFLKRANDSVR